MKKTWEKIRTKFQKDGSGLPEKSICKMIEDVMVEEDAIWGP